MLASGRSSGLVGRALLVALVALSPRVFAQSKGSGTGKPEPAKAEAPKAEAPKAEAPKAEARKAEGSTPEPADPPGSLPSIEALDAMPASEREAIGVDPRRGRGTRNVGTPAPRPEEPPKAAKKDAPAPSKAPPRPEPDANHRRQVALGPTDEELTTPRDDAELAKLREAELVLFPRPLPGLVPGWSWDLPRPVESSLPEIVAGAPGVSRAIVVPEESGSAPQAGWLRGLTMPNVPVRMEERVIRYLSFYRDSPSGRSIARVWVKKSGRYTPLLRAELAKAGLPTDLVFLSLIESGHNPTIVSPAGAAGLWQFMPDAGRAYGLIVDRWVDERLDPERSTAAACRYLSDLYRRFGSWELGMAAYNMGYGGLSRAVRKYNTNDFWELSRYEAGLPWETTLYVPKILATAIVMSNRRVFGVDDVTPDPPDRYDTVLVGAGVPLREIARLAAVPESVIESLNPQYLSGRTPPTNRGKSWPVRVPAGTGASLTQALAREAPDDESLFAYIVRAGETVEAIAQVRGTTEALIRAINRIDPKEVLAPGTVLLVPRTESAADAQGEENVVVVPPRVFSYPDRRRVFYRVVTGDSIAKVGELFRVSRNDLFLWNALDASARLHPGMALQIYASQRQTLAHVRHLPEDKARILIAGSPDFFDYFEGQNGKKRIVVRAKSNDSLALIGKRYGMTVGSMERVNRRSRTDPVQLGEPIVVYTERSTPVTGDSLYIDAVSRAVIGSPAPQRSGAPAGASAVSSD